MSIHFAAHENTWSAEKKILQSEDKWVKVKPKQLDVSIYQGPTQNSVLMSKTSYHCCQNIFAWKLHDQSLCLWGNGER